MVPLPLRNRSDPVSTPNVEPLWCLSCLPGKKTDRCTPPKPTRPGLWSDRVFGGTSVTACSTPARRPVSAAGAWGGPYTAVPLRFWRALGASLNTFAIESLIDQLAAAAGADCRGCRWRLTATWSSTRAWLTRGSAAGRARARRLPPSVRGLSPMSRLSASSIVPHVAMMSG